MKHLSLESRQIIEEKLNKGEDTFTEIARCLGFNRTSIADEITKRRIMGKQRTYGISNVFCKNANDCANAKNGICNKRCNDFVALECEKLKKPPYVCNSCNKKASCKLVKYYYRYNEAHEMYKATLTNSRSGLNITKETIDAINNIIAPLIIKKKHTINQVYINHPEILYFSKSEFYRLVNNGYVNILPIDLPRAIKYRKRKSSISKEHITRTDTLRLRNRTYLDYTIFINKNQITNTMQFDTVEGNKERK